MDEDNTIDEISRIEAQIEELAEVSERCRRIILVSKAAIAGGVALPLFMMLGLFGSNQVAVIGSMAVVLGGIVSLGSNVSCACRKSNPDILVVQPAENWAAKNVPGPLDGARDWRILLQG
jgi:hypothetical protein